MRRKSVFKIVKKGNCEAPTSCHCLEAELKRYAKVRIALPTHLDTQLFRMPRILVCNLCTSDTGITSTSQPCREAIVSETAGVV